MKSCLLLLCLTFCATHIQAESENQISKIDILGFVSNGAAVLTATEWDIGQVNYCFDGDTTTIMRSANINPAFVQIAFTEPQTVSRMRVLLGEPEYPYIDRNDWWMEIAASQSDMDAQTGTYRLLLPRRTDVAGEWDEATLPMATTARLWEFNIQRTVGDNYVHIPELELWSGTLHTNQFLIILSNPLYETGILNAAWTATGRIWKAKDGPAR